MTNDRRRMTTFGIVLALALMAPADARADVALFFEGPERVQTGAQVTYVLKARIDQPVNAFEGRIESSGDVRVTGVSDAGSVIRQWPVRPAVADGAVLFAGVIPGGISPALTDEVELVRITAVIEAGGGSLSVQDAQVFLHQPDARLSGVSSEPRTITADTDAPSVETSAADVADEAYVALKRDPLVYDGDWFLLWEVRTPSGSADVLTVRERRFGLWGSARDVSAPHRLDDQRRTSILEVTIPEGPVVARIIPWPLWAAWAVLLGIALGILQMLVRHSKR